MDETISRLEKEAEKHLRYKIQEQQSYFSKHKTFFKPPDEPGTKYGSFPPIFGTQICYRYYTEINADVLSKTIIDVVYSYAVQDDCGGMWGLELRWYVGAVFAVPITGDKQLKTLSIVCQHIESFGRIPSRPEYINGVVKCPTETTKVYYSASGYYAIQFFSLPSPIKAFRFEDVPHSCRKCCNDLTVNGDIFKLAKVNDASNISSFFNSETGDRNFSTCFPD